MNKSDRDSPPDSSLFDDSTSVSRSYRYLVPAGLVVLGAALVIGGVDSHQIQLWLKNSGPWAPVLFVFGGIAFMSMLLPKTVVSLAAGALFGTLTGCYLMLVIGVSAAALNYAIGRWWLHDSVLQQLDRYAQSGKAPWAGAVRELAAEAGFGFHLLIRVAPIPTMLISYAMGAAGARWLPFISAAAVAIIPQTLWIHSGTLMSVAQAGPISTARWISGSIALLAGIAISCLVPREAMRRLRQQP